MIFNFRRSHGLNDQNKIRNKLTNSDFGVIAVIFFFLGMFISFGVPVFASPGTSSDPLVSLSWVDNYINSSFDELAAQIDQLKDDLNNTNNNYIILYIGNNTASINGEQVILDVAPCLINNYTMLPLRFVGEALNININWDNQSKTVICSNSIKKVILPMGGKIATINGNSYTLTAAPVIRDGRVLVPARFIAEAFSCHVDWLGTEKRVDIY